MKSLLALLLLLPLPLFAQEPTLSEAEKLKIENLNLKLQLAQTMVKLEQLEADLASCQVKLSIPEFDKAAQELVGEIEKAHPGYIFDPQSGSFLPKKPE